MKAPQTKRKKRNGEKNRKTTRTQKDAKSTHPKEEIKKKRIRDEREEVQKNKTRKGEQEALLSVHFKSIVVKRGWILWFGWLVLTTYILDELLAIGEGDGGRDGVDDHGQVGVLKILGAAVLQQVRRQGITGNVTWKRTSQETRQLPSLLLRTTRRVHTLDEGSEAQGGVHDGVSPHINLHVFGPHAVEDFPIAETLVLAQLGQVILTGVQGVAGPLVVHRAPGGAITLPFTGGVNVVGVRGLVAERGLIWLIEAT